MENKSLYCFYFDESNKNGNIKFKMVFLISGAKVEDLKKVLNTMSGAISDGMHKTVLLQWKNTKKLKTYGQPSFFQV